MPALGPEVQRFIAACEAIHGLLAEGKELTADERQIIEEVAIELLGKVRRNQKDQAG
ncbi:MAG TPA: hypothetical protein VJ746_03145 [Nitrospira sp.]|nr:hypothetical protein [Nitrospira sp.]